MLMAKFGENQMKSVSIAEENDWDGGFAWFVGLIA